MTYFSISENTLLTPPDGGIIYTETDLHRLIPEPLNTLTAGIFFIISVYWLQRLHKSYLRQQFLSAAALILLVGSLGGIAYHGLRRYPFFIAMDWLPILLLCMMACGYFWIKIVRRWTLVISLMFLSLVLQLLVRLYLERFAELDWGISVSYGIMALMVIVPLLIVAGRSNYAHSKFVFRSIGCFAVALICRELDRYALLPMGTHFLWHIFGAIATHCMFRYIYLTDGSRSAVQVEMS